MSTNTGCIACALLEDGEFIHPPHTCQSNIDSFPVPGGKPLHVRVRERIKDIDAFDYSIVEMVTDLEQLTDEVAALRTELEKERIITAEACRQHESAQAALLAMRERAENAEHDLRRVLTWLDTERLDPTERLWVERRKRALGEHHTDQEDT